MRDRQWSAIEAAIIANLDAAVAWVRENTPSTGRVAHIHHEIYGTFAGQDQSPFVDEVNA